MASALVSAAGEVENVGVAAQVGLPPCLAGIGVVDVEGPGGTFGAVTGPGGTLTAVLTVAGREFALVDAVTKDRLLDGWGGVMSVFSTRRVVTQVAWTAVGTPSGMGEHLAWADAQGEGAERSGAAWQAYGELVASVSGRVAEHTVLLSVTVSRARLVHRRRPSGETGEERLASALREAVNTARNQLMAAGLAVTVPMTAAQIADSVRARISPSEAKRRRTAQALGAPLEGRAFGASGPMAVTETAEHVEIDGRYSASYLIAEWPGRAQSAGWMEPFLRWDGSVDRSVTVLFQPVSPAASDREIDRSLSRLDGDAEVRAKRGMRTSARHMRERRDVVRREEELVAGFREATFVGVVTITADSVDELYEGMDEVEVHAYNGGLELRRLWGRQAAAWALGLGLGVTVKRAW